MRTENDVETVVLLTHQKQPDDYLRIHVDLDELDKTKSESKATYGKIKEYISDKYDMKVSFHGGQVILL